MLVRCRRRARRGRRAARAARDRVAAQPRRHPEGAPRARCEPRRRHHRHQPDDPPAAADLHRRRGPRGRRGRRVRPRWARRSRPPSTAVATRCWSSCRAGARPASRSGGRSRGGEAGPADTNVAGRDPRPGRGEHPGGSPTSAGDRVPVVMSTQAWNDYEIPGSPHVVLVDGGTGKVRGEGAAGTWPQVIRPRGPGPRRPGPTPGRGCPTRSPARDNADRIDAELAAHGIGGGHESLYPGPTVTGTPARRRPAARGRRRDPVDLVALR